jgi:acyl carrier protein
VLTYEVPPGANAHQTVILPLGRPLPNAEIYLLDAYLNPVPVGVPGELHIGGPSLARGYINRAELTAEKFVPHPFSRQPGQRLYKTGDLARYLPDGNIEFLGRLDHQVKIRGFRVELEEIEAVLSEHPSVLAAAVMVGEDPSGNSRLNAYVARDAGKPLTPEELRGFLQAKLPDHMVPAAFVVRDELPRTPQGKIDRRSLSAFEPLRPPVGQSYVAPRTPLEEKLVEIWSQLLGLEQVSVDDNFFDLGGHSLLAMQLIARVQKAFHVELPVRALFNSPTVAGVAETITQLQSSGPEVHAPVITPVAREPRRARTGRN